MQPACHELCTLAQCINHERCTNLCTICTHFHQQHQREHWQKIKVHWRLERDQARTHYALALYFVQSVLTQLLSSPVYNECAQNTQFTHTCRADSAHCRRQSTRGPMVEGGPACGRAAVELSYLDSRNGYRRVPRCCHLCAQAVTRSYLRAYLPPFPSASFPGDRTCNFFRCATMDSRHPNVLIVFHSAQCYSATTVNQQKLHQSIGGYPPPP